MHADEGQTVVEICRRERGSEGRRASSALRAPLRLRASTSVPDARDQLARAGEVIALVTHRGADVGVVTAQDLAPGSSGATAIGDVMGHEVVCIDPTTDLQETLRTYTQAAWASAIRRRPGR